MRARLWTGSVLAGVCLLLAGCSTSPDRAPVAGPAPATAAAPGHLVVPQARFPTLAAHGVSDVTLVGARTDGHDGVFVVESGDRGRTWGKVTSLSRTPADQPVVALNARGVGAVAWAESDGGGAVAIRVRHADGTWAAPHRIRDATTYGPPTVLVNDRGDVAVGFANENGEQLVSVSRAGAAWTTSTTPGGVLAPLALDGAGVVHAAVLQVDHGGRGTVSTTRLALGGSWTPLRHVDVGSEQVQDVELVVDAEGRETLGVGYVGRWVSTLDTDVYWSTAHEVVRQAVPGGGYAQVWKRDGATTLALDQVGSTVQLTWEEWRRPDRRQPPHPHSSVLMTQRLAPTRGPAARLTTRSVAVTQRGYARFDHASAVAPGGRVCVLWRSRSTGGSVGATRRSTVAGEAARTTTIAGTAVPAKLATDLATAQIAVSGSRVFVAVVTKGDDGSPAVEVLRG